MFRKVSSNYDQHEIEPRILKFWDERRTFHRLVEKNKHGKRFSFIDGPMTANNSMGVHHAWGRTYKDIFVRYKAMQGFHQRYQNGFDCQGLWVEVEVEKDLGLNSKKDIRDYGLDNFSRRCKERVLKYAGVLTEQSKRLGQWMDWDNSYLTMTDTNIEYIWMFIKRCHEKGWLYRGAHVMPWCIRCGTSLSQHEMTDSYRDIKDPSVFILLPIVGRENEHFMVWTTTPWTLAANTALAVNPELVYLKIEHEGKVVYLSKGTLKSVLGEAHVLAEINGAEFKGWRYRGPFDELPAQEGIDHRVVCDSMVGETEGSGIVHIAPGCGAEDFEIQQREGLGIVDPVNESGRYREGFGKLTGMLVSEVAPVVYESLKEKGYLFKVGQIVHRYPVCWRCDDQLIFRLVEEWFIRCEQLREPLIEAARTVVWMPDYMGKRMEDWLNNMRDWCISRRRFWGLPLPFYYCQDCSHITMVGSREELAERAGIPIDDLPELHRPWIDAIAIKCEKCGGKAIRTEDVGDCWLDAGIVPFSTLKYPIGSESDRSYWEQWFPAEFISEMREQIRLWFYSMLFMSVTLEGRTPYQKVLLYEKVFDEHGNPMHKSSGNVIWFDEAAETMGVDVMRWMFAGQNNAYNINFGFGPAREIKRKLLTLWNSYTFFMTYASIDQPELSPSMSTADGLTQLDRWILSRLNTVIGDVSAAYEQYSAITVVKHVEAFFDDLTNWYIRRNRRRFWRASSDANKQAAYQTLYTVLVELTKLIAPVVPFLAEEIYQNLVVAVHEDAPESVHLCDFPKRRDDMVDAELEEEVALAKSVVSLGLSARNKAGIKVRQPLGRLLVRLEGPEQEAMLRRSEPDVLEELNVKKLEVVESLAGMAEPTVKFNLKQVGPRMGPRLGEAQRALEADRQRVYEAAIRKEPVSLTVGGHTESFEPGDFILELTGVEEYSVAAEGSLAVALDSGLNRALVEEGMAREIIRHVQVLRKNANLDVEDKISMEIICSQRIRDVLQRKLPQFEPVTLEGWINRETLTTHWVWGTGPWPSGTRPGKLRVSVGISPTGHLEYEDVEIVVVRQP